MANQSDEPKVQNKDEAENPSSSPFWTTTNKRRLVYVSILTAVVVPTLYFELIDSPYNISAETWKFICNNPLIFAAMLALALWELRILYKSLVSDSELKPESLEIVEEHKEGQLTEEKKQSNSEKAKQLNQDLALNIAAVTVTFGGVITMIGLMNKHPEIIDLALDNWILLLGTALIAVAYFGYRTHLMAKNAEEKDKVTPLAEPKFAAQHAVIGGVGLVIGCNFIWQNPSSLDTAGLAMALGIIAYTGIVIALSYLRPSAEKTQPDPPANAI